MKLKTILRKRSFHAHESARMVALNGLPLATFWQRVLGYFVDVTLAVLVWVPLEFAWRRYVLHQEKIELIWDFHEKGNIVVAMFYWGLANYFGNGQTPGKWVARTRAVSLTSERLGRWQSVEPHLATVPPFSREVWDLYSSSGTAIACARKTGSQRPLLWM